MTKSNSFSFSIRALFFTVFLFTLNSPAPWHGYASYLSAVWGSSGSDVFVTGVEGDKTIMLHYDGSGWLTLSLPATTERLNDIWGSSDSDVFAVGQNGTILHYDGETWSEMYSGVLRDLNGIWGTSGNDVFVVGDWGTILHYDGKIWSPILSGTLKNLSSIWGSSNSDMFVSGGSEIFHYDGVAWSKMQFDAPDTYIVDVWGSSGSDVFGVGNEMYSGVIYHYNGTTWSKVFSGCASGRLNSIWGTSGNVGFAVGGYAQTGNSGYCVISIYNYVPLNNASDYSSAIGSGERVQGGSLYDIWGSSGSDVFAVGYEWVGDWMEGEQVYRRKSIIHFDGTTWTSMLNKSDFPWSMFLPAMKLPTQ